MKILCLNTAFNIADIVLENDGKIVKSCLNASAKTSESVMPEIDRILQQENLKISDLNIISVVVGTGSFTGIRIGVALVKGMVAVFPNIKIIAVNSLDLMAYEFVKKNSKLKENFAVVQNALSGRFFVKEFDSNGNQIKKEELVTELPKCKLVGLECENLGFDEEITFSPENLLNFSLKQIQEQKFVSVQELAPIYLRLSQAEENLLKGTKNAKN